MKLFGFVSVLVSIFVPSTASALPGRVADIVQRQQSCNLTAACSDTSDETLIADLFGCPSGNLTSPPTLACMCPYLTQLSSTCLSCAAEQNGFTMAEVQSQCAGVSGSGHSGASNLVILQGEGKLALAALVLFGVEMKCDMFSLPSDQRPSSLAASGISTAL